MSLWDEIWQGESRWNKEYMCQMLNFGCFILLVFKANSEASWHKSHIMQKDEKWFLIDQLVIDYLNWINVLNHMIQFGIVSCLKYKSF